MEITGTDPRTYRGHEFDEPAAYWVLLWDKQDGSDEYRITGASNIFEVLGWAARQAGKHQRYAIYVESGSPYDPTDRHMTMVVGDDPNIPED